MKILEAKMNFLRAVFCGIFLLAAAGAFAQGETKGRLVNATRNGKDITGMFEPIVSVVQEEVMGVRSIKLELSGVRPYDSKVYEFYNSGDANSLIWKRRMRGVVVDPIAVYITIIASEGGTKQLLINYEYTDSKGFGSVDYIIALQG
jgi:hypothetical protein